MRYFILTLLVVVSACAARQMTADENSVSFVVKTGLISDNTGEAQQRASAHCSRFDKKAALRSMNSVANNRTVAVFECVN